jgi:hypothetical protein
MQAAFAVAKRLFARNHHPLTRDELLRIDVSDLVRCVQAVTPSEGWWEARVLRQPLCARPVLPLQS